MSAPHLSLPRSPISKSATEATVAPIGAGVIQAPPLPGSSWASPPQRPPLRTWFLPPWCPCWPVLRGDSSSACLPALVSGEQVGVSQPPSSHSHTWHPGVQRGEALSCRTDLLLHARFAPHTVPRPLPSTSSRPLGVQKQGTRHALKAPVPESRAYNPPLQAAHPTVQPHRRTHGDTAQQLQPSGSRPCGQPDGTLFPSLITRCNMTSHGGPRTAL